MENLIELLKKIITNVLTALYQPFWFAVILTVFLLFFNLYTYKPIETGKGIRAAFRAWWQEFRTSLFFRKLFLLTFFTVMILFQTLINRNMWINPLSDIMGGWWIWHTAADGTVTLTTEIYEKEKNNQMMISILSQIVEFRNGESGLHVLHINILSELLLERLVQKTDKYQISAQRRSLITTASALHDIGKIGIDDKILNKPGRLTPEEFDEMKKHTIIGESILKNVGIYQNEELVQLAMQICRWHHERYDGRGYPDGLKGEEIPIEVQVVSIADVYDALVSERVYKKAYSHKKAVEMILNGECGQFNPLLLECLQDIQDRIDEEFQNVENQSEEENQERKVHDQIMETTVLG